MRLYEGPTLMTNPRRVTIYLAEKGLSLESVKLDMRGGQGRSPEYLAKNPAGTVPLLELDDGGHLPESAAIIEYLEELHPEPNMLGDSPERRAQTRATERIAVEFILRNGSILVNTHPFMTRVRPGTVQHPAVADFFTPARDRMLAVLEARLGDKAFLAWDRPTIADCTLYAGLHVHSALFEWTIPEAAPRLKAWYDRFSLRPSAQFP